MNWAMWRNTSHRQFDPGGWRGNPPQPPGSNWSPGSIVKPDANLFLDSALGNGKVAARIEELILKKEFLLTESWL